MKDEEEELQEYTCLEKDIFDSLPDELTGEELPAHLVHDAREEGCSFMEDWGVWEEVPVEVCWRRSGRRPIGTRWVDVNKGDAAKPDVRC